MELMCQNTVEPSTENCRQEHDSLVQFKSQKTRQLSANVDKNEHTLQSHKIQFTEDSNQFSSETKKEGYTNCQTSIVV